MMKLTEQKIKEGNKLIVEFIGNISGITSYPDEPLEFHVSWDWLMPVLNKIGSYYHKGFPINYAITDRGVNIMINESNASAQKYVGERIIADTLNINYFAETEVQKENYTQIQSVWIGVVQFIEWYNKNKETI